MSNNPTQPRMFGEEDLPLFSGTAPKGHVETFEPKAQPDAEQTNFLTDTEDSKEAK